MSRHCCCNLCCTAATARHYCFTVLFVLRCRYILFAEGRSDLARDLTIENITGRTPQQISDSGNGSNRSRTGSNSAADPADSLQDVARRAAAAMDEPLSSGKMSASERGFGQGGSRSGGAVDGVSGALQDFEQIAEELSPDSGKNW
jgi:hypothetical protein